MRRRSAIIRCALCCALLAALAAACGDDGGGDAAPTTTTSTTEVSTTETTEVGHTDEDREAFTIRPVLGSGPCPVPIPDIGTTTSATPMPEQDPSTTGTALEPEAPTSEAPGPLDTLPEGLDGQVPTTDGRFCYRLGPAGADGNDLVDATVSSNEGQWQVFARVEPDSLDDLNAFLNGCFTGSPECPPGEGGRGYAAFVWDGRVLYATAIGTEDLADSGLLLAGGQTERRARDLLALINR